MTETHHLLHITVESLLTVIQQLPFIISSLLLMCDTIIVTETCNWNYLPLSPLSTYNLFIRFIDICSIYTTSAFCNFIGNVICSYDNSSLILQSRASIDLLNDTHPQVPIQCSFLSSTTSKNLHMSFSAVPPPHVLGILVPLIISKIEKVNFLLSIYQQSWRGIWITSLFQLLVFELRCSSYSWYNAELFLISQTQFSLVEP